MTSEEREKIESILKAIPASEWRALLSSKEGSELADRLASVRGALQEADVTTLGPPKRPIGELIDLLGHNLLSDGRIGEWLREQLLRYAATVYSWKRLFEDYRDSDRVYADTLHGNSTQDGVGSEVMAGYWRRGGTWAEKFCKELDLPDCLWQSRGNVRQGDELLEQPRPMPPLHDFQQAAYDQFRRVLREGQGKACVVSLPTGAGKTRVAVEALCDELMYETVRDRPRFVLWVAQSDELLRQAWECFRQVWMAPRPQSEASRRQPPLSMIRAWGSRKIDEIQLNDGPGVIIAGVQQLGAWIRGGERLSAVLPRRYMVAAIVDETHRVLTPEHSAVLRALDLRDERGWRPLKESPPVVGLTATPWRSDTEESQALRRYFQESLVGPEILGAQPVTKLQEMGVLGKIVGETLRAGTAPAMTEKQHAAFEKLHDLPADYLDQLGRYAPRNGAILRRLLKLPRKRRTIVFACSIAHAETLALALNRVAGDDTAAVVTGLTPTAARHATIDRFRRGELRFLCNVSVLTTGFDAPLTDTVVIARPTKSALLYEQMVGRGMRGPANGGTSECFVIDVQDKGLPTGVLSYQRVLADWSQTAGAQAGVTESPSVLAT